MTEATLTPSTSQTYRADALAVTRALGASRGAYAVLDQYGVIDAAGADALDFLHNQLTNDVSHLQPDQSALGGYCSPKGRLIASFLYWLQVGEPGNTSAADVPAVSGVRLLISADIREAIQKRLSMFVLRSKVKLTDATPTLGIIGLAALSSQADALRAVFVQNGLTVPEQIRGRTEHAGRTLVRLPDAAGAERYLLLVAHESVTALSTALEASLTRIDAPTWDWLDIQSGEPRITAATQDSFVPQMINFEALGGVNFRKGCYPGQEVVARSQYRGTVKRRATIASAQAAKPGDEIFDAADPLQPCGHVVNVAPSPAGDFICLVELKLSISADARLHIAATDGPGLTVLGLPYALPDLNA
jgi:folate-binding protein YgfZ